MSKKIPSSKNSFSPRKKKIYGQHFLRNFSIVENIVKQVDTKNRNILEIGCGDGFLTNGILNLSRCKKLVAIEVDEEWFFFVKNKFVDPRLEVLNQDILEFDFELLKPLAPMVLLANLPYNITFPILERLIKHKLLFSDLIIMIQEEVAQKLVAFDSRAVGPISLFIQNNFEIKLLEKIGPENFSPAPKVVSRTVHLKPLTNNIETSEKFWSFVKQCFKTPRQTLKNNLKRTCFSKDLDILPVDILEQRPQKLTLDEYLNIWKKLKN